MIGSALAARYGLALGSPLRLRCRTASRRSRWRGSPTPPRAEEAAVLETVVLIDVGRGAAALPPGRPRLAHRPHRDRGRPRPHRAAPPRGRARRAGERAGLDRRAAHRRLRAQPHRPQPAGARGGHVPHLQHGDVRRRAAARGDRHAAPAGRDRAGRSSPSSCSRRRRPRPWARSSASASAGCWARAPCASSRRRSTTSTTSSPSPGRRSPRFTVAKAVALGLGAGVLSAVAPALEAARVEPVEALRRSSFERPRAPPAAPRSAPRAPSLAALGGLLLLASGALPRRELRRPLRDRPRPRPPGPSRHRRRDGPGDAARRPPRRHARPARHANGHPFRQPHRRRGRGPGRGRLGHDRRRPDDRELPLDRRELARPHAARRRLRRRAVRRRGARVFPTISPGRAGEGGRGPGRRVGRDLPLRARGEPARRGEPGRRRPAPRPRHAPLPLRRGRPRAGVGRGEGGRGDRDRAVRLPPPAARARRDRHPRHRPRAAHLPGGRRLLRLRDRAGHRLPDPQRLRALLGRPRRHLGRGAPRAGRVDRGR